MANEDFQYGISIEKYTGSDTKVVIPAEIDGMPVTVIGDNAFENCREVTEICLPDSLKKIGNMAFGYCSRLKEINLPDSVTEIGAYAFWYCGLLKKIRIPRRVKIIQECTFWCCDALEDVEIPDSVEIICNNAFNYCNLKEIYIPDSVGEIKKNAFDYCKYLERVHINTNQWTEQELKEIFIGHTEIIPSQKIETPPIEEEFQARWEEYKAKWWKENSSDSAVESTTK